MSDFETSRRRAPRGVRSLLMSMVVVATIVATLGTSGCTAWRATTQMPVYEHTRRARPNMPASRDVYKLRGWESIFTTLESPVLYYEDVSLPVRMQQRHWTHWVRVGPAWLVENVYMIAASPILWISALVAGDEWYRTDKDPSINMEISSVSESLWWLFTRPVYIFDFVLYDVPTVLFVYPYNAIFRSGKEPEWRERWAPDPEDAAPRHRNDPGSQWDSFTGAGQL